MNSPGLTQMFVNLSETFPLIVNLVFLLMALFGLFVGFRGLQSLYRLTQHGQIAFMWEGNFSSLVTLSWICLYTVVSLSSIL